MSAPDNDAHAENPSTPGRSGSIKFLEKQRPPERRVYLFAFGILLAAMLYALWYDTAFLPAHQQPLKGKAPQVTDHLWIDNMPRVETDTFQIYFFSSEDPVGIHDGAQSAYKHLLEVFTFSQKASELAFSFPHDRRTARTAFKVEKLARPQGELDLQLTLEADPQCGGEAHTYFSSTHWSSLDRSTWPSALRQLPALPLHP